jgi:hypothetical protein
MSYGILNGAGGLGAEPTPIVSTQTPVSVSRPIPTPVLYIGGAALLALIGFAVYKEYKITSKIAEREGSSGLLKYHGGKAAIGVASRWLEPRRSDR